MPEIRDWRQELKDLFTDEAAKIMYEVYDEIRENLKTGKVDLSRMVRPDVAALREEIFGDTDDQTGTDDQTSERDPYAGPAIGYEIGDDEGITYPWEE